MHARGCQKSENLLHGRLAGWAGRGGQAAGRVHTGWSPLAFFNLAGWFLHQKSAISKLLGLDYIHYQVYF